MADEIVLPLRPFDTQLVFGLANRVPGLYKRQFTTTGNSLLSSVFIKSADPGAILEVKYYQTTGSTEDDGEKQLLETQHIPLTAAEAGQTFTILLAKFHDKPFVEATVIGGMVNWSLYVTLLTTTASDFDAALKLDAETIALLIDKGLPAMTYDDSDGKVYFLRSNGGVLEVSMSEAGDSVHSSGFEVSDPGNPVDVIDVTVPVGKTRKLNQAVVVCRQHGNYVVTVDGDTIGSGRTGPGHPKDTFTWTPRFSATAGQQLKVTFTALLGTAAVDVECYLMGSDI